MTELIYHTRFGCLMRVNGQTRPVSMDEIEQEFGQPVLNQVMESAGQWVSPLPALTPVTRSVRRLDPVAWGSVAASA